MNRLTRGKGTVIAALFFVLLSLGGFLITRQNVGLYKEAGYSSLYKQTWSSIELEKWKLNFQRFGYHTGDLQTILQDSVGILPGDSTITRLKKIADFIIPRTEGRFGSQDLDVLKGRDPFEQLCLVNEGKSGILCGMVSFIYAYFLENAGIVSRYISLEKFNDNVIGTHVVLEVYIPETGRWIYSDLTYGIMFVQAGTERLNLVQVIEALKNKQHVLAYTLKKEKQLPSSGMPVDYINYMRSIDQIRYFPGKQLRNSLLPFSIWESIYNKINPTYSFLLYTNEPGWPPPFWLHKISRWLLILSMLMLIIILFRKSFKF